MVMMRVREGAGWGDRGNPDSFDGEERSKCYTQNSMAIRKLGSPSTTFN